MGLIMTELNAGRMIVIIFFSVCAMNMNSESAASHSRSALSVLPCLERVMPCQYRLQSLEPHASCCMPIEVMIKYDPDCLCHIFCNDGILQLLNITKPGAQKLLAKCGVQDKFNQCEDQLTTNTTLKKIETPNNVPLGGSSRNADGVSSLVLISSLLVIGLL